MKSNNLFRLTTFDMVLMGMFVALTCALSFFPIPLPFTPIPITLQTAVIFTSALLLTPYQSSLVVIVYLLIGFLGLPVFSGGKGSLGVLFSPSGGYLIGFLVSAFVISCLKGKNPNIIRYLFITLFIGTPIIYLLGNVTVSYYAGLSYLAAFTYSTFPFIIGDIVKCILSCFLALVLSKHLNRFKFYESQKNS